MWIGLRHAARLVGLTPRAIGQRINRRKSPLPVDYARDPDGNALEPRQPLISVAALRAEFPGKEIILSDDIDP